MHSYLFLMGRHSLGRSPGDLGSRAAAAALGGGEATSSVLALSGAGMGLPRRIRSSVKERGATAGSTRRGRRASFPAAAAAATRGVRGGGEEEEGEECLVVVADGIVESAALKVIMGKEFRNGHSVFAV